MSTSFTLQALVLTMCLAPLLLLGALALPSLLRRAMAERVVGLLTALALLTGLLAACAALLRQLLTGAGPQLLRYGAWFSYGRGGFAVDFAVDALSLGFAALALGVCAVVAAFSFRYLHREPGFHRYFVQLTLFVLGITLVALAGSVEVLFAGWELIGISSALLVGFFHERREPVRNALRVFAVYRVSDAAMLGAAVLLHHWAGDGSLSRLFTAARGVAAGLTPGQTLTIALLLLLAVAGKSALLPFSGWLPRAMEGPTPSSAVYYGALSIHAGCYLLLRAEPLLAASPLARGLAVAAGVSTALYAALIGRVQTDVKSALSYAALTQVGIIVVEIALGFTTVAMLHIVGHVCFRLLQFLSAPNILHDLHAIENRLGASLAAHPAAAAGGPLRAALYLVALQRGFTDALLERGLVAPLLWLIDRLDRLDRALVGRGADVEARP